MDRFTRYNEETEQYEVLANEHSVAIREERLECGDNLFRNIVRYLHYVNGEIVDRLAAYENIGTLEEFERIMSEAHRYEKEQKELYEKAERKVVELQKERNKLHAAMNEIQKISGTLDYNEYV